MQHVFFAEIKLDIESIFRGVRIKARAEDSVEGILKPTPFNQGWKK